MSIEVFSPVPPEDDRVHAMAPGVASLDGLTIGFLGNLKPNCDVLLHTTERLVIEVGAIGTVYREKESASLGADIAVLDELARLVSAGVVGLGD